MSKKFVLSDVRPFRVSLVDRGAIQKDFLIYKNHGNSKFTQGGKLMKIEEAIKLGLVDEDEANRITKKDETFFDFHQLMAGIAKMLGKVEKKEEKPVEKMTDEEKKKMEECNKAEVEKLSKQIEELTKSVSDMKKGQELLAKLGSTDDPQEFLKVLKDVKELYKKEDKPADASERIVKMLDSIEKRLSAQELKSKGLKGQEVVEKKSSKWGGVFK